MASLEPQTIEEALELAKVLAEEACAKMFLAAEARPHLQVRGNCIFVVWPEERA